MFCTHRMLFTQKVQRSCVTPMRAVRGVRTSTIVRASLFQKENKVRGVIVQASMWSAKTRKQDDMHAQGEPNTTDFRVFIKDKSALRNCSVSPHTSTCRWHHRVALARYPPQG